MTVNCHRRSLRRHARFVCYTHRVFWGRVDITRRVYYLDKRRRLAKTYQIDSGGRFYLDPVTHDLVTEILRGRRLTVTRTRQKGRHGR